jgi:hypothetical protein
MIHFIYIYTHTHTNTHTHTHQSRTHTTRGVRLVDCSLDDVRVFAGEIRKAPGDLRACARYTETILFTNSVR